MFEIMSGKCPRHAGAFRGLDALSGTCQVSKACSRSQWSVLYWPGRLAERETTVDGQLGKVVIHFAVTFIL